mmetsp:Transcript_99060/g.275739  ORF Transcript_99060/g.275739 Transcript_99060/m.275739 type:complete len:327 (-) Transcript_99060:126-1106(-)
MVPLGGPQGHRLQPPAPDCHLPLDLDRALGALGALRFHSLERLGVVERPRQQHPRDHRWHRVRIAQLPGLPWRHKAVLVRDAQPPSGGRAVVVGQAGHHVQPGRLRVLDAVPFRRERCGRRRRVRRCGRRQAALRWRRGRGLHPHHRHPCCVLLRVRRRGGGQVVVRLGGRRPTGDRPRLRRHRRVHSGRLVGGVPRVRDVVAARRLHSPCRGDVGLRRLKHDLLQPGLAAPRRRRHRAPQGRLDGSALGFRGGRRAARARLGRLAAGPTAWPRFGAHGARALEEGEGGAAPGTAERRSVPPRRWRSPEDAPLGRSRGRGTSGGAT